MPSLIVIGRWIHAHRGLIISLIAALIIAVLFLVIRLEISKIETLSGQISDLKNQNQALIEQLSTAAEDVKAVRQYLFSLENIAVQERQELQKNEEICENVTDFDSIIPRINELFGYCEPPAAEAGH
jgi:outer membrane murein-binding lipoprotein Lpp